MITFFRIVNDTLYSISREHLGFSKDDPSYISDDYLKKQKFMVMRTCHGIGDWVLLSAMPRLLKQKYPDSKVYIPSRKLLKKVFGDMLNNWGYGTFDVSTIPKLVFQNNPYVDGFIDEFKDEVFHDHYKIYDPKNDKIPLLSQMLDFWQMGKLEDVDPEFYPTDEEESWCDELNLGNYGYICLTSTFGKTAETQPLIDVFNEYELIEDIDKWLVYTENPIEETSFNFLKDPVLVKEMNINIRQQQLLKTRAIVNLGNESGMNLWTARYSTSYILNNKYFGPIHGAHLDGKKRERPFKSGNYVTGCVYL